MSPGVGIAAAVQFAMGVCPLVAVAWWGTAGFGLLLGERRQGAALAG